MRTFHIAILIAAGVLVLSSFGAQAADAKKPNILFIYADDQSYKTVGCYPESWPWVKTPNLDKLAATGIRFHAAYLGSWCMPSRASLLTGRWPHGIESMRMEGKYPASAYDPAQCPFWPRVFREKGYHTAQIGKWHTGVDAGTGRDWDHQIVWNRPLHPENAGAYYDREILSFNGTERWQDGYPADNYTDWACEYIRGQHRDPQKPWYLWLCYGSVHGPSKPAARHKGMYKDAAVSAPADIFPPRTGKPDYLNRTQAWSRSSDGRIVAGKSGESFGDAAGAKAKTHEDWVRQVNECVPAIDEGVGRLIATLRETGQLENTLVVYSADQGFAMGEHGFRTKLGPYDANYRSPLIVSMPGVIPEGKTCNVPVGSPDLVATFFAFANFDQPWKFHGRDLTPLLRDPNSSWPHPCFYQHAGDHYGSAVAARLKADPAKAEHNHVPWYNVVIQDGFKYVDYLRPTEPDELYDLRRDPEELVNLATSPDQQSRLAEFRSVLAAELERTEGAALITTAAAQTK